MYWLLILLVPLFAVMYLGWREKNKNAEALKKIPVRINVNGIRGKSTVTRLIFSILREAGYHVIGKTTGSATRMMFWDQKEETIIQRPPSGPSIVEQLSVIQNAADYGAKALVCECMAVRPDYQETYQHDMLQANITVIVNVLKDHLDEMGPTTTQISWAFAKSIPKNGTLVVSDDRFLPYFKKEAAKLGTRVIVFDENKVPEELTPLIARGIFPANCAAALAVAKALDIPQDVALRGIFNVQEDPGSLKIQQITTERGTGNFINAFAANEPDSSLKIWELLHEIEGIPLENPLLLFNARPDRVDRTTLFGRDFFPKMPASELMVIGQSGKTLIKDVNQGLYPGIQRVYDLTERPLEDVIRALLPLAVDRTVFGIGNLHGAAEAMMEELENAGILTEAPQAAIDELAHVHLIDHGNPADEEVY